MLSSIKLYILHWVESNLNTGKNISDLIPLTGYSRKTIENWFFQEYGLSIGNYLFRRRMSRASVLLRLSELSIIEIADLLHYSSSQNFSRAYRLFAGKTPSEYRKSKEWDVTVLQYSLLYDMNIEQINKCTLPVRYLQGHTYHIQESFFYTPENISFNGLQKLIKRLIPSSEGDLFVSIKTVDTPELEKGRAGIVNAEASVGKISLTAHCSDLTVPGGEFCHCRFIGTWRDYYIYSFNFFIKLLSDSKYVYAGGNHYINFHSVNGENRDEINCDLFIPIRLK